MVQLRFTSKDTQGKDVVRTWSFEPLEGGLGTLGLDQDREQERLARGRYRRRVYSEQEIRTCTIPAGTLIVPENMLAFRQLIRADKVECKREVGGQVVWVEFDLDLPQLVEFEILEEIDPLKRYKIRLVQSNPLLSSQFEDVKKQFTD